MADTVANPATINPTEEELFLSRLKNETSSLHRKLERSPVSAVLMNPAITAEDYARYLAAMRAVIAWCEKIIFPVVSSVISDVEARRKLSALDHDLASLKKFTTASDIFPEFTCPTPSTLTRALGFLYVLEGSSLGGMVIVKQLQSQPFLTPDTSTFLTIYGKNTGAYWKTFLRELCLFAMNNPADEIINGAKEAFQSIDNYFCSIHATT